MIATRFLDLIARFQPIIGDYRAKFWYYTDQNFKVDYDFKVA